MGIAAVYVHIVKIKSLSIMFYHYLNIAAVKGSNFFQIYVFIMKTDKQQKGADTVKINIELIEQLRKQEATVWSKWLQS